MFFVLVVFMVAPEGFDYANAGVPTSGSPFSRMVWLSILGLGAYYTYKQWKFAKAIALGNRYFLGFVILAGLSYFWSIEPGITLRREIRIVSIYLAALACVSATRNPQIFQRALRPVLTFLMIGSIIFVAAAPDIAVEHLQLAELIGAWKGMTTQKNALGSLSAMATILWVHAWMTGQSRQPWPLLGTLVSATCLINSRSSTSIMATVFAITLMSMMVHSPKSLRRYMPYFIATFVCILLLYSLAVLHLVSGLDFMLKPITAITGKDLTFSNRTSIWEIIVEHIQLNPWLGTGYGAYWIGLVPESPSYITLIKLSFYPTESHNGYIDIINDLGWVGGIMLFSYILMYLRQGLRLFAVDRKQAALFLVILFEQMIANMSESMWWNARTVELAIMSLATLGLSQAVIVTQSPQIRLRQKLGDMNRAVLNRLRSKRRNRV